MKDPIIFRTLQHRLMMMVRSGRLEKVSHGRWTVYKVPSDQLGDPETRTDDEYPNKAHPGYVPCPPGMPDASLTLFIMSYRPNRSSILSDKERKHLYGLGKQDVSFLLPGEYASGTISHDLEVDLARHSCRLEGCDYKRRDILRHLYFGVKPDGMTATESQMVNNHYRALNFLFDNSDLINFDLRTIYPLYGHLSRGMLSDREAEKRNKRLSITMPHSRYIKLFMSDFKDSTLIDMLSKLMSIFDPFEQALFWLAHCAIIQPFDNFYAPLSRLAANIPLLRNNLAPLTFTKVGRADFSRVCLHTQENWEFKELKELFISTYEHSAEQYRLGRETPSRSDPLDPEYQNKQYKLIGEIISKCIVHKEAFEFISDWTNQRVFSEDRERFRVEAEDEIIIIFHGRAWVCRKSFGKIDGWREAWQALLAKELAN